MIDIILATYNGEKYIRQQILSLIAQTYTDWRCIIHDDGSTDKTVSIIKEFALIDSRIILKEDSVCLHNAAKNFLHTLSYSSSDYICFCDQDDIWLDTKLEKLFAAIKDRNEGIPLVVFSNAYLWNCTENKIFGKATLAFPNDIASLLFLNCGIQGASAIFNKKMKEVLLVPLEKCVMHDWYLTIVGCTFGEIDYLNENLMLYRQHGKNVTGSADGLMSYKTKNALKRKSPLVDRKHLESLKAFLAVWNQSLSECDRKSIERFIQASDKKFFYRLRLIFSGKWRIYDSRIKLIAKFLLRPYIRSSK